MDGSALFSLRLSLQVAVVATILMVLFLTVLSGVALYLANKYSPLGDTASRFP
ncbi:MAG: hypothetical protein AB7S77_20380 [Desulfatirhabdiaceae bacterium]